MHKGLSEGDSQAPIQEGDAQLLSCILQTVAHCVALVTSLPNELPMMIYSSAAVPTQTGSMDLAGCLTPGVDGSPVSYFFPQQCLK